QGRDSLLRADSLPLRHYARKRIATPQHSAGPRNFARLDQIANLAARDRMIAPPYRRNNFGLEHVLAAQLPERSRVARGPISKPEIFTHHHGPRFELAGQNLSYK